tara:strand:+ start:380 stop:496 length:117 start_codon:yes stop_codon:yes gene_type:complete
LPVSEIFFRTPLNKKYGGLGLALTDDKNGYTAKGHLFE